MIGFFTDPYPDELLYSACARYHHRARYRHKETTMRDLFGNPHSSVAVDFPSRLGYLVGQLPANTYSVDALIERHTMLPLYSRFMSPAKYEKLRTEMVGNGGLSIHAQTGILTCPAYTVKYLRLCPACIEEDRAQYGECYWHRLHQIPAILVCPKHSLFLLDSSVGMRCGGRDRFFTTAKQAASDLRSVENAEIASPKNRVHKILLTLAKDAFWLLTARAELTEHAVVHRRYLCLLHDRKFATYLGTVRWPTLKTEFQDYYSGDFLQRLGFELRGKYHWLKRLHNDWKRAHLPIEHLLLMQFLRCSAEEFFQSPTEIEPYGKGPWPCLNAAHDHYLQNVINECRVTDIHDRRKRPVGSFTCDCGFSYRRTGADAGPKRRLEYDRVISFGDVWYKRLDELRAKGASQSEMAGILRVSVNTIHCEITRVTKARVAGTPLNRRHTRYSGETPKSDETALSVQHRKRWLETAAQNPTASRTTIGRQVHTAYDWLLEHDRQWLDDTSPVDPRTYRPLERVDWSERDASCALHIRETATIIRNLEGRPVRASTQAILSRLGIVTLVYIRFEQLPLVRAALQEVAETHMSFVVRRIRWAARYFESQHIPARKWELVTRAAIGSQIVARPEIQAALAECVESLEEMNRLGWPESNDQSAEKRDSTSTMAVTVS